jgi:SAM-dependent methyltransferase
MEAGEDKTVTEQSSDPGGPSMREKFVAWWEGYDLSGRKKRKREEEQAEAEAAGKGGGKGGPGLNRFGKPLWSASRVGVAEKIWGANFVTPGGADLIINLTKPLGLNPAATVLDLGAGLGGSTRCIAATYGAWVTGLEHSPFLVEQGMQRSVKAGLSKQAPIEQYDPENLKYGKRVDAVLAKDVLFTISNKAGLLDKIESILKPRGQLLFTDYVVDPAHCDHPAIRKWAEREPLEPKLWSVQDVTAAIAQCNLDLRVHEDLTDYHRALIVASIKSLTDHLEKHHLDQETKVNVIDEVELWANRIAALGSGLRLYRFYALKGGE